MRSIIGAHSALKVSPCTLPSIGLASPPPFSLSGWPYSYLRYAQGALYSTALTFSLPCTCSHPAWSAVPRLLRLLTGLFFSHPGHGTVSGVVGEEFNKTSTREPMRGTRREWKRLSAFSCLHIYDYKYIYMSLAIFKHRYTCRNNVRQNTFVVLKECLLTRRAVCWGRGWAGGQGIICFDSTDFIDPFVYEEVNMLAN